MTPSTTAATPLLALRASTNSANLSAAGIDEKAVTANWIRQKLRNMAGAIKAKRLTNKAAYSNTRDVSLKYNDWSDDEFEADEAFEKSKNEYLKLLETSEN